MDDSARQWWELDCSVHSDDISRISVQAYSREAELLQANAFPPLIEAAADIAVSQHRFFAAGSDGQIAAVAEIEEHPGYWLIARLVVGDDHLRRGWGRFLLTSLFGAVDTHEWRVVTAADNGPALNLYRGLGFNPHRRWTSPDSYQLIGLSRVSR